MFISITIAFQWYSILCTWLDAPGVDFFEVREWLLSWKNRIPSTLTSFPTIQGLYYLFNTSI